MSTDITVEQLLGKTDSHITWLSESIGVHHQMLEKFQLMQAAAQQDGIDITIASGFRSFERQLAIWNRKVSGELPVKDLKNLPVDLSTLTPQEQLKAILLYSALPGTSRHHWGTDIDVYSTNVLSVNQQLKLELWEYGQAGPFYPLSCWLDKNASLFGFYRPYQTYQGGVAPEAWHLSYAPLAKLFQYAFNKVGITELAKLLISSDIHLQTTIVEQLDFITEQYINNISEFPHG